MALVTTQMTKCARTCRDGEAFKILISAIVETIDAQTHTLSVVVVRSGLLNEFYYETIAPVVRRTSDISVFG